MAGAEAWLIRNYSNPSRGVSVSVMLLGGLPGKISTHTPDVCYTGAGYTLNSASAFEHRDGPDRRSAGFKTALATRKGRIHRICGFSGAGTPRMVGQHPKNPASGIRGRTARQYSANSTSSGRLPESSSIPEAILATIS